MEIKLPFWFSKKEIEKISLAAENYWDIVKGWVSWGLTQQDPETCTERVLGYLAYQRNITRFNTEPLSLFRLRVKYAFINSVDAGSVAGLKRIFLRLNIGDLDILERQDNRDWDVIILRLTDDQLSGNSELISVLVRQYGRTCRRYEIQIETNISCGVACCEFNNTWAVNSAEYKG